MRGTLVYPTLCVHRLPLHLLLHRDVLVLLVKTGHSGGAEAGALSNVIAMEQVSAGGS